MGADKELIRKRFEANFSRYHSLARVQRDICAELAGLTKEHCMAGAVGRAMEIGVGTGFLTSHLTRMFPQAQWFLNDISQAAESFVAGYAPPRASFLWGDAENIGFPPELDLIASASTVQWFDRLPEFAKRAGDATVGGGWLVISTFGPDNFREIRETTGEGLEYYTVDELIDIIGAVGYKVAAAQEYRQALCFETPMDVLRHIKATGVNSLGKTRWGKGRLADFDARYRAGYSSAGVVSLTYHPILLVAQKI